jgi:hypothetical protein
MNMSPMLQVVDATPVSAISGGVRKLNFCRMLEFELYQLLIPSHGGWTQYLYLEWNHLA